MCVYIYILNNSNQGFTMCNINSNLSFLFEKSNAPPILQTCNYEYTFWLNCFSSNFKFGE